MKIQPPFILLVVCAFAFLTVYPADAVIYGKLGDGEATISWAEGIRHWEPGPSAQAEVKGVDTMQDKTLKRRSPLISFILSLVLVGVGQAYNKQYIWATVHWIIACLCIAVVIYARLSDDPADYVLIITPSLILVLGATIIFVVNWCVSFISAPISSYMINKRLF